MTLYGKMRLERYAVTVIVADPGDPETHIKTSMVLPRAKLLATPLLDSLVNALEAMVQEGEDAQHDENAYAAEAHDAAHRRK